MNSIATRSPAGEKVTTLWMTLAALTLKAEFWAPSRVAGPNSTPDRWAASQSPRRYGAIKVMERIRYKKRVPVVLDLEVVHAQYRARFEFGPDDELM